MRNRVKVNQFVYQVNHIYNPKVFKPKTVTTHEHSESLLEPCLTHYKENSPRFEREGTELESNLPNDMKVPARPSKPPN